MATANVVVLRTGTGFTIDVTACNLSSDLTVKDFVVLVAGVVNNNANWAKTSQTVLTYSGSSLAANTSVEVRRLTPTSPIQVVSFAQRFSSGDFNNEIDRISRRAEEYALNGVGAGSLVSVATPDDSAFGVGWSGDTLHPPSRNTLYNYLITLATLASPTFTGDPKAPTPLTADNDTSIATTAFVQSNLTSYAPLASPTFTGTPIVPTANYYDNSQQAANTAQAVNKLRLWTKGHTAATTTSPINTINGVINWNTPTKDLDSALVTTTGRWTCPRSGIWRLTSSVEFGGTPTTPVAYYLFLYNITDSVTIFSSPGKAWNTGAGTNGDTCNGHVQLVAGKVYSMATYVAAASGTYSVGGTLTDRNLWSMEYVSP